MNSLILLFSGRILLPLSIAFSLWLLWRGHNEPGGGFIGGLVAAAGIAVHALARGADAVGAILRLRPTTIAAAGVLLALASSLPGFAGGAPLLTHQWWISEGGFALGTTLLFDAGVYLAVAGSILTFLAPYLEERRLPDRSLVPLRGPARPGKTDASD